MGVKGVGIREVWWGRVGIRKVCLVGLWGEFWKSSVELVKSWGLKNVDSGGK